MKINGKGNAMHAMKGNGFFFLYNLLSIKKGTPNKYYQQFIFSAFSKIKIKTFKLEYNVCRF